MGKKIFVSYKHRDAAVRQLHSDHNTTARNYVDELIDLFKGDGEIYKGEGDEDLSEFKNETIKTRLKEKIHDSSITIILISPNMKENSKKESDQWISWEISYSLKEITRNDKTSHTNAVLAVVLPNKQESYEYFIENDICQHCDARLLKTDRLFQILRDNMFNIKEPAYSNCPHHAENSIYTGESSYIISVKWQNFVNNKDRYLKRAIRVRDDRKLYNITKEVTDEG